MANITINSYSGVICSGCLSHHPTKGCIRLHKTGTIPPVKIVNGVEVCTEFETDPGDYDERDPMLDMGSDFGTGNE